MNERINVKKRKFIAKTMNIINIIIFVHLTIYIALFIRFKNNDKKKFIYL